MKINEQLIESYATEKSIGEQNTWNTTIHVAILFIALCFTPISGALKIVIYISVYAIVGAIDSHSRNRTAESLRTNLYLRSIFYLQNEKDSERAKEIELKEWRELNEKDPLEAVPSAKFTTSAKVILVFTYLVSIVILGVTGM